MYFLFISDLKFQRSGNYSVDVGKLGLCLLDLICEGLGLQTRFFEDPSLGLPKHNDINLITLLQEQVHGLQVLKDDQWMAIEPVPNGFVVNIGHMLQVALPVPADIDIANSIEPLHICEIAKELNLSPDHYDLYGKYKAKVLLLVIDELKGFGWVLYGGWRDNSYPSWRRQVDHYSWTLSSFGCFSR
ncbi:hypothetical protein FF1_004064 [Malus domestica]